MLYYAWYCVLQTRNDGDCHSVVSYHGNWLLEQYVFALGSSCFHPLAVHGRRKGDVNGDNSSIFKNFLVAPIGCGIMSPLNFLDERF